MKLFQSGLIVFLTLVILISCSPGMRYSSVQDFKLQDKVILNTSTVANPDSGELIINVSIQNDSDQGVMIISNQAKLQSPEGVLVEPEAIAGPEFILPGDSGHVTITFIPVNSKWVYNNIGWNGDLERQYWLSLDFLQNSQNEVLNKNMLQIEMPIDQYRKYLGKKALEPHLALYKLSDQSIKNVYADLEKNMTTNIPMVAPFIPSPGKQKPENDSHAILIQGQEFFLDGLSVRVALYRIDKTAKLFMTISNRRVENMILDMDNILLEADGQAMEISDLKTSSKEKGPLFEIKQKEQLELNAEFKLKQESKSVILHLDGLKYKGELSYFTKGIVYTNEVMGLNER